MTFDEFQAFEPFELMRWMPPPDGIECAKVVLLEPR